MSHSWLRRLFASMRGEIPEALRSQLQTECPILMEEGLRVGLRFKKYRAPGQGFTGFKNLYGYGALTHVRLVSKGYSRNDFDIPLDQVTKENFQYGFRKENCFYFAFEAETFYADRSGRVEVRLFTDKAQEFVLRLDALLAED